MVCAEPRLYSFSWKLLVNIRETVNISGVVITGGNAVSGAGILNNGTLTVTDSTFSNNSANYGGGILNNGALTITNCTFTDNFATVYGGGILNDGTLTITNCTFTDNFATVYGGGISNANSMTVTNCTISGNSASYGGSGINSVSDNLILNNTIIAGNISDGVSDDIDGQVQLISSNNLIGDGTGITDLPLYSTNLAGTTANPINPLLGPLQNNGGPTETMALLPGSPAIGTGNVSLAVDTKGVQLQYDQRGAGYSRTTNGAVDIGAYEVQQIIPTVSVTDNDGTYNGTPYVAIAIVNGQSSLDGFTPTLDYQQYINGVWNDLGANAPVNAGSYDVTANFAPITGSTDYSAAPSPTVDFSITPATATVDVTAISGLAYNWNAQETVFYSVIGVNGPFLPNGNFTDTTVHTNAGTYTDTWTFTDPNYISQFGTVTDTIAKANPGIGVTPGTAVYNGFPQNLVSSIGAVVGVPNVVVNDTHTNVGTYTDSWTFTDTTGNFNNASGTMVDQITPARANVGVQPYTTTYNGLAQSAVGTVGTLPSSDLVLSTI